MKQRKSLNPKVALVHPHQTSPPLLSLGLEYLSPFLKKEGFEVKVLDLCLADDWASEVRGFFSQDDFFAIGVNIRNVDDMSVISRHFFVSEYKEKIELIKSCTSTPIILGGPGFSLNPEAILDFCGVDLGIRGEGEESFPLLLNKMLNGDDFEEVPGLVMRKDGRFYSNPPKPLNLETLPIPIRGALNNGRYLSEGGIGFIEAKRGCNKRCNYCPDPWIKTPPIRYRSPESIADETKNLLELGVDHIYFSDSEFNVPDEGFASEICRKLIREGLGYKVRWYIDALPAPFSDEFCRLLQSAGCAGVAFNIDVCSDKMLQNIGRDFTVDDIEKAAEIAHRNRLPFVFYLLFGLPSENRETVKESIGNLKKLPASGFETILGVRVIPGTKLERMIKDQGSFKENPSLYGELEGNEGLLKPVIYISSELGPEEEARKYISGLIGDDERFFFRRKSKGESVATWGNNEILTKAIEAGYRGIHWDILRQLKKDGALANLVKQLEEEAEVSQKK